MKNAISGNTLYNGRRSTSTNAIKRPRSPTRVPTALTNFIDLTFDDDIEAPPAKRQRSHTPVVKNIATAKTSTIIKSSNTRAVTPQVTNENESPASSTKKKSPFRNIPLWRTKHDDQPGASQNSQSGLTVDGSRDGHTSIPTTKSQHTVSKFPDLSKLAKSSKHKSNGDLHGKTSIKDPPRGREDVSAKEAFRMPEAQPLKFNAGSPQDFMARNGDVIDIDDNSDFTVEKPNSFKMCSTNTLKFDPKDQQSSKRSSLFQPESTAVKRPARQSGTNAQDQHKKLKPVVNNPSTTGSQARSSGIQINLPVRESPVPPRIQRDIPRSSSQTSLPPVPTVNLPLSKDRQARKEMIGKLKKDTNFAKTHPAEVERVIGLTGFDESRYPTDLVELRLKEVAQPKKRKVNREDVRLDLVKTSKCKDDHNIVSPLEKLTFIHPREQAKAVLTDRFGEKFNPPLVFLNKVNNARLDGKFQFISSNIFRKGVKASTYISQSGCKCTGPCQLDCSCLRKVFDDHISKGAEQVQSYQRRADGITVLTSNYMTNFARRAEISECNSRCGCPPNCSNRVVQKGRTIPLEIFQTPRCGFGVRSSQPIVRGQFIELYLGELITENDLCRREAAQEEDSSSYVYSLDWFPSHSSSSYHIDGRNFGSAMRFVNHSCNPNARTFTSLSDNSTLQIYDVAFFATRDIRPFEEITIDYSPQMQGEVYDMDEEDEDVVLCLCGSENCRRKLWRQGKERKGRKRFVGKDDD